MATPRGLWCWRVNPRNLKQGPCSKLSIFMEMLCKRIFISVTKCPLCPFYFNSTYLDIGIKDGKRDNLNLPPPKLCSTHLPTPPQTLLHPHPLKLFFAPLLENSVLSFSSKTLLLPPPPKICLTPLVPNSAEKKNPGNKIADFEF